LDKADAIAVLAGSSTFVERTEHAANLFKQGRADKILLTNDNQRGSWSEAKQQNPLYVESAAERLQSLGVPAERIEILWQANSSTYDEALRLKEYGNTHKLRSLLVVTSAYHSRRAVWTLNKVFTGTGIRVGMSPVEPGQQSPPPVTWWLHPRGWKMVALEYPKIIYYRFQYN
jgi:uncharacterized SAM-binding protein YcdF (DUF218 family)